MSSFTKLHAISGYATAAPVRSAAVWSARKAASAVRIRLAFAVIAAEAALTSPVSSASVSDL